MDIHVQQFKKKKCFPISVVLEAYSERLQTYGFLFFILSFGHHTFKDSILLSEHTYNSC